MLIIREKEPDRMPNMHVPSLSDIHRTANRLFNHVWMNIDVKSFMAGMLVVGVLVVFQQNFRSNQLNMHLDFRNQNQQYGILNTNTVAGGGTDRTDNNSIDVTSTQRTNFVTNDSVNNSDYDQHKKSEDTYVDNGSNLFDQSKDYVRHNHYPSHKNRNVPNDTQYNQSNKDDVKDGYHTHNEDIQDVNMVTRTRSFHAYGQASALFVHMGSYRGGPNSFAVIGLGAKPAHVYGNAGFECEWESAGTVQNSMNEGLATDLLGNKSIKGKTVKYLPDWNMGRQYTVVVVNCSFEQPVGADREGGKLMVYALYGEGSGRPDMMPEKFIALTEKKGEYDAEKFRPPYPYDFVYCGSPLYGKLNAQRIREWMAYHVKLFGKRAHFFLHDAGGVSASVERVLRPWRERGYITLQDIREEERYDGYYHNQFLVVNDCLHRTRFLSTWTFFFDVDEYVYVPKGESLVSVMQGFSNYTQVIFPQKPMAPHLCTPSQLNISRKWGFEKLVYRNVKAGITWDRKYAIQARSAFTAGVHRSDYIFGDNIVRDSLGYFPESVVPGLWYYHFHNTITHNTELCTTFVDPLAHYRIPSNASSSALEPAHFYDVDGTPYRLDIGLQELALSIKNFEVQYIGSLPTTFD